MRISDAQTDQSSLANFGVDAAKLLISGDYLELASRYSYLRALDRDPALAIEEDLALSLSELEASRLSVSIEADVPSVKYFAPNATNLFALIEVEVAAENGRKVLVELVTTVFEGHKHVVLEDISTET